MEGFLQFEKQRAVRQEMDTIIKALAKRLEDTPWMFDSHSRSWRVSALVKLEAKLLIDRYSELKESLNSPQYEQKTKHDAQAEFEAALDGPAPAAYDLEAKYRKFSGKGLQKYKCEYTDKLNVDEIYTSAEQYGRFLDLRPLYELFPEAEPYEEWLKRFPHLDGPAKYLYELQKYLMDAFARIKIFENAPSEDTVSGAQDESSNALYCKACAKQFSSEGVFKGHLAGKKHQRAAANYTDLTFSVPLIQAYCDRLGDTIEATRANAMRERALTSRERHAEKEALSESIRREDEDLNEEVHKPKIAVKPLLGPDGTPIPSWLWKLNGMGQEFKCEICGDYTYHGRKAFEKHFDEQRHTHGLTCLGIAPSPIYKGLALIDEVMAIKAPKQEEDPEMEDDQGNVMTQRVYNDLKRQGLI